MKQSDCAVCKNMNHAQTVYTSTYSMSAGEDYPPPIKSTVHRIKKIMARYEVKNQILNEIAKISAQNL